MTHKLTSEIIKSLDSTLFNKYLFQLWKLLDKKVLSNEFHSTLKKENVGFGVLEEHYCSKNGPLKSRQGFNYIVPFHTPIDLFGNQNSQILDSPSIIKTLNRINKRLNEIERRWVYWLDGNLASSIIQFITRLEGFTEEFYMDQLIPKLENNLKSKNYYFDISVGSIDSFLNLHEENTKKALQNILKDSFQNLSISYNDGKLRLENFSTQKYISEGVISKNLPIEPIFSIFEKSSLIQEFEDVLNSGKETTIEKFITDYHQFILGEEYDRVERQIWLRPAFEIANKDRRIDMFLRNSVDSNWELFELKNIKNPIKKYRDLYVFKSEILNSISQLLYYKRILESDKVKEDLKRNGIEYFNPEMRLIIGRKPNIPKSEWDLLISLHSRDLKILTYDDLSIAMTNRLKNFISLFNESKINCL